jgi:hypothetical protein
MQDIQSSVCSSCADSEGRTNKKLMISVRYSAAGISMKNIPSLSFQNILPNFDQLNTSTSEGSCSVEEGFSSEELS